jgi:hypothetical protein
MLNQPPAPADVYNCPIDDCQWQHTGRPFEIPEGATPDDVATIGQQYTTDIQDAMVLHFNHDHTGVEWANQVARLRQALIERPPLLCFGCYVERHNARRAGQPMRPQNMVQIIINGDGRCLEHIKLEDGPVMPGRTGSGLIVPGQIPPPGLNGQAN